ncbi:MAG: hypothetical protein HY904_24745 [Deltaproteobacteria bacterium]|nr:hypothetical protein [Deltaproteobacteria bacterium]
MVTATRPRPRILEAERSGRTLADKLGASIRDVTVADAAAKTGLALRDAERGLQWALTTYRGNLKVAEGGDVVYSFPTGFTRPWATRETLSEWASRVGKWLWTGIKAGMKVWLLVTMIAYTVIFALILIGITLAASGRSSDDDDRGGRGFSLGDFFLMRMFIDLVTDAIWASFHYRAIRQYDDDRYGRRRKPGKRLYERVWQFIFGPEEKPVDPLEQERLLLAFIRDHHGRVGVWDVMSVTALDRPEAERLVTRLLVDYEGDVEVTEEGAVFYVFKDLRKTAEAVVLPTRVPMAWERPVQVPALTGDNSVGTNLLVVGLNSFNLAMGAWAASVGLTLANLQAILAGIPPYRWPDHSIPILLGVIPIAFSATVFTLPVGRALGRIRDVAKAQVQNGRRALLRLIRGSAGGGVTGEQAARAWEQGSGFAPSEDQLTRQLLRLGGDLQIEEGRKDWRFPELAHELAALREARSGASDDEAKLGPVVFDTEKPLPES